MTHASLAVRPHSRLDVSSPVSDRDAVKVQALTIVTKEGAIASTIVEGLNHSLHSHGVAMDPWPNTLTMANALSADSRPLLD